MSKRCDGFTLMELIVVIAILAVLAGVVAPSYAGYVQRAKDAQVLLELDAVLTAVQVSNMEGGNIVKIIISDHGKRIEIFEQNNRGDLFGELNERFAQIYGFESTSNQSGIIFAEDAIVDLQGSSFEYGAVWYAYDGMDGANSLAGWSPLSAEQ